MKDILPLFLVHGYLLLSCSRVILHPSGLFFSSRRFEINISGSGLKFKSQDSINEGDFLDIKLVLPIASGVIIELIGEVVHVEGSSEKNDASQPDMKDIAVKFAAINEDDREFIIRYVFKRQRELLRAEANE